MEAGRTVHVAAADGDILYELQRLLRYAGYATIAYGSASALSKAAAVGLATGCLVLDIRMPGLDGLELRVQLNELSACLPIIMMAREAAEPRMAVSAVKAGDFESIERPVDGERFLGAIGVALTETARAAREREVAEAAAMVDALSPRERQVLDGLMAGHPNKAIAHDLSISVRTVEVHRARMLERLGTHSLGTAVKLAVMASFASGEARTSGAGSPLVVVTR
jgi:two-component system response regulator FixJ